MLNITRIKSDVMPDSIQNLGDNTYYYNYDIQSDEVDMPNMNGESELKTIYNYIQVHLRGIPSYKECVKAIIRKYIDADEEFDVINSYNKYLIDGENLDDRDKYMQYLNLLNEIKTKVKADFKQ